MSEKSPIAPPYLRVVRGNPTVDEIAALVVVLSAAAGSRRSQAQRSVPVWSSPARSVRTTLQPGIGGWRVQGQPR